MSYQIITNNPNIVDNQSRVNFVEGDFEDVLIKVRDLVHSGYELISHPLGASLRMFFSPYRSILVGDKASDPNEIYIQMIENSIENYRKHMKERNPDLENKEDYAFVDEELLRSSIEEHKKLNKLENKL